MTTRKAQDRPSDAEFQGIVDAAQYGIHRVIRHRRMGRSKPAFAAGLAVLVVAGGSAAVAATKLAAPDEEARSDVFPAFPAGPTAPPKPGEDVSIGPWTISKPPRTSRQSISKTGALDTCARTTWPRAARIRRSSERSVETSRSSCRSTPRTDKRSLVSS